MFVTRRSFVSASLFGLLPGRTKVAGRRPDILLMYADDLRWDAFGVMQREQGDWPWGRRATPEDLQRTGEGGWFPLAGRVQLGRRTAATGSDAGRQTRAEVQIVGGTMCDKTMNSSAGSRLRRSEKPPRAAGLPHIFRVGLLIAALFCAQPAEAAEFYVAPTGNDAWPGTLQAPFASLERARDAIRQLKDRASLTGPVTVYVRGGTYTLSKPLMFTPADSGTTESRSIYKAYANETPVLSGGRAIAGWRRVSGDSDFPKGGLGAPPLQEDLWMADVPWNFRDLFVNGQRRKRARAPTRGFFTVDGEISAENPARFRFRPGDIDPAWVAGGHAEVGALLKWGGFHLLLKAVDAETRIATLSTRRQPWGNDKDPRYWVENIPQALDAPGEWYLEHPDGVLYYHAMPGEDMLRATVVAPRLRQLIRFEGDPEDGDGRLSALVHDISLQGLTLSYTDSSTLTTGWTQSYIEWSKPEDGHIDEQAVIDVPAAVEGVGVTSISIDRCIFTGLGGYAVQFQGGAKGNQITRSVMTDLGAGGVKLGASRAPSYDAQITSGNIVSDNTIHDIGIVYPAAVGIVVMQSAGNTIAHNEIYDTPYTGISIGWTWGYGPHWARDNIIEFNHLYNIGQGILSDLGCIYTVGVQPGTVVRNNLCHGVARYEHGYGGWGIYADEGSGSLLIENNIVYRTHDAGFHQHFGRENIVRNNIFAMGRTGQIQRTRSEKHTSFVVERNIFYWQDAPLLARSWEDGNYKFDHNLYFEAGSRSIKFAGKSFDEWRRTGQDVHSVIADPLFVDPEGGDFSLRPGSPALKTGFKPIDLKGVGPRKSE